LILTKEDSDKIPGKYVTIVDSNGNNLGEVELYTVGHEDEEGNECDEEGNEY